MHMHIQKQVCRRIALLLFFPPNPYRKQLKDFIDRSADRMIDTEIDRCMHLLSRRTITNRRENKSHSTNAQIRCGCRVSERQKCIANKDRDKKFAGVPERMGERERGMVKRRVGGRGETTTFVSIPINYTGN